MGFFDQLQKEMKKAAKSSQGTANNFFGNDYREVYLSRHPQRYHECNECGEILDIESPREVTIDHIVPQSCGGTNAITNLQVLCQSCNSRKKDKINALTLKYSGEALLREAKRVFRK